MKHMNGNAALATCSGTFRNSSHITTDLVFGGTATTCASFATRRGFLVNNNLSAGITGTTVSFYFDDAATGANGGFLTGETLEFDCDTDLGVGIDGASHAGSTCTVWVRFPSGAVVRSTGTATVITAGLSSGVTF